MSKVPTVQMVQTGKHTWSIKSTSSGAIIQSNITIHNEYSANEYVKRYVSSFSDWTYEVVPLKDPK